ncbi:hypothetical protein ASA1KI_22650 [Opitutales bacterium ASA1]|nr:hypothetical protein ASA1KI_22650 [Opitutales bacterium ASA1]
MLAALEFFKRGPLRRNAKASTCDGWRASGASASSRPRLKEFSGCALRSSLRCRCLPEASLRDGLFKVWPDRDRAARFAAPPAPSLGRTKPKSHA